jgi:hypothetical protein
LRNTFSRCKTYKEAGGLRFETHVWNTEWWMEGWAGEFQTLGGCRTCMQWSSSDSCFAQRAD